jgi:hypothetical protein
LTPSFDEIAICVTWLTAAEAMLPSFIALGGEYTFFFGCHGGGGHGGGGKHH